MTVIYLTIGMTAAILALLFAAFSIGKLKAHYDIMDAEKEETKKTVEVANETQDNVLKLNDAAVSKRLSKWRR